MESSQCAVLTRQRANEILAEASALLAQNPCLRLGQAICNVSTSEDWPTAWPDLFHEEDPVKATEIFYDIVEDHGCRKLSGKLDMPFLNK